MSKHNMYELKQYQSLSLDSKIRMTVQRINAWVKQYGTSGVYVSFSGGKDSTVLLDIVRKECGYSNIPAVFVDVPTQFPELRQFAQEFDENVVIIRPKMSFVEVCKKYGFPLISKEICENVHGAKKYYKKLQEEFGEMSDEELASLLNRKLKNKEGGSNQRLAIMLGWFTKDREIRADAANLNVKSRFSYERYKFLLDAPFDVSNECCLYLKKKPAHDYNKETGRHPITPQMTDESRLRLQQWVLHGCNQFDAKHPISNPMSFWTEQDVLQYIYERKLPICSVYGEVVKDENGVFSTTGQKRTGCMVCGFGCQLDKSPNRFEMLRETHPNMYRLLDIAKNNGVTMREAIEYMNEKGDMDIKL